MSLNKKPNEIKHHNDFSYVYDYEYEYVHEYDNDEDDNDDENDEDDNDDDNDDDDDDMCQQGWGMSLGMTRLVGDGLGTAGGDHDDLIIMIL